MEELMEQLEWYITQLSNYYKVDEETACKALAESLRQTKVNEPLYMDACYVIERDMGRV